MAWICRRCGNTFDEPDSVRYCVDEYNGTQGLFGNWQYAYYEACPECGSEDIAHIYEDDESEEDEDLRGTKAKEKERLNAQKEYIEYATEV